MIEGDENGGHFNRTMSRKEKGKAITFLDRKGAGGTTSPGAKEGLNERQIASRLRGQTTKRSFRTLTGEKIN